MTTSPRRDPGADPTQDPAQDPRRNPPTNGHVDLSHADNIDAGIEIDERPVPRQILIFVGGTGLEALTRLAVELKASGHRFGNEFQKGLAVIPHAIFIDTNKGDVDKADSRNKTAQLSELTDMGVRVVNMFRSNLNSTLISSGVKDHATGQVLIENPNNAGAESDPRLGMYQYAGVRESNIEGTDPLIEVRSILREFREPGPQGQHRPFVGEIIVTSVGGLHGGTGPSALLIEADAMRLAREMFPQETNNSVQIIGERIAMTSQSGEKSLDGNLKGSRLTQKRRRNTAAGLALANAAFARRGMQITPEHRHEAECCPEYTMILGGSNPHRDVGGHYEPMATAAAILAARIKTGNDLQNLRNNARPSRNQAKGPNTPNAPLSIFISAGASTLTTNPSARVVNAQNEAKRFGEDSGLFAPKMDIVAAETEATLPRRKIQDILAGVSAPTKGIEDFGDTEDYGEIPGTIKGTVSEFLRDSVAVTLKENVRKELMQSRRGIVNDISSKVEEVKSRAGLATALEYVQTLLRRIDELKTIAQTEREDCSPEALEARSKAIEALTTEISKMEISELKLGGLLGKGKRKRSMDAMQGELVKLATLLTQYAEMKKKQLILQENVFDDQILGTLRTHLTGIESNILREKQTAEEEFTRMEGAIVGKDLTTALDVSVPAEGLMTPTGDVDILRAAANQRILSVMDRNSEPLTVPVDARASRELMEETTMAVTIPLRRHDTPEASRQAALATGAYLPKWRDNVVAVDAHGSFSAIKQVNRWNLIVNDAYARACFQAMLEVVPTREMAERMGANGGSGEEAAREDSFPWKDMQADMLNPIFEAIARREFENNGEKGEITTCPTTECGVKYYRDEFSIKRGQATCCPGCEKYRKHVKAGGQQQA
ncbi:MAG: hypothetical protein Q8P62_05575 [Candidatus Peregrinibacteria bacterium]|nr:hypothetical protein [Candidatus Peregrinibacteria bacterium]